MDVLHWNEGLAHSFIGRLFAGNILPAIKQKIQKIHKIQFQASEVLLENRSCPGIESLVCCCGVGLHIYYLMGLKFIVSLRTILDV